MSYRGEPIDFIEFIMYTGFGMKFWFETGKRKGVN